MPLTLQPLNRREFCRNALGGTLAAFIASTAWGQETGKDHWVFLSDTHISADTETGAHGYNQSKNFAAACEEVLKLTEKPQGIIVTGDFAYLEGKPEDYKQLVNQTAPYLDNGIPVHVALGNHDRLENYYAAFTQYKKESAPVADEHLTVIETPNANLFLLDSLQKGKGNGFFGEEQLSWLQKELAARDTKPAILFAHHNIGDLDDRAAYWQVVKNTKHVKAYISGHTHLYTQELRDNVHFITLPALGYEFQKGKQPLGWTDAEISANGIRLTLHSVPAAHAKDGDVRTYEWLR